MLPLPPPGPAEQQNPGDMSSLALPQAHRAQSSGPRQYDQGITGLPQYNIRNHNDATQVEYDMNVEVNRAHFQQVNVAVHADTGALIEAAQQQIDAARNESHLISSQAAAALTQAADENQSLRSEADRLVRTAQA